MKHKNVIFCGGGTAGHLYPGLVVSEKLQERDAELKIMFVGGSRSLEKDIMSRSRFGFIPLKIEGLKGKGIKTIPSLLILPLAFIKSFVLLTRSRPRLVVGLGGYSSGPVVLLASWLKIPTLVLEQNAYPGFTNRLLIPWIRKAVVAFEGTLPYFKGKGQHIGNPARGEFEHIPSKPRNNKLSILIFGGSQGSHFLNTQITLSLPLFSKRKESLIVYHQTGQKDFEWVKKEYDEHGFRDADVAPFYYDMPRHFQKADLIICRAGATTLAELIASQKAAILVPFALATDNHQLLNAQELERVGGAEILQEKDFTPELLFQKITYFIDHKEALDRLEKNLRQLKRDNIAEKIADLCLDMMQNGHKEANP